MSAVTEQEWKCVMILRDWRIRRRERGDSKSMKEESERERGPGERCGGEENGLLRLKRGEGNGEWEGIKKERLKG